MYVLKSFFALAAFFTVLTIGSPSEAPPAVYFVDAIYGSDLNTGLDAAKAWKTLDKVNAQLFKPGDKLLLRAGMIYEGQLKPVGSGSASRIISIDRYGTGDKPRIQGNGAYQAAVYLFNAQYWSINNLDISNFGAASKASRYGVWVHLEDFGTAHNIVLKGLDVHDVNGSLVKKEGGGAGIMCSNEGQAMRSRFDQLSIENCSVKRCARNGILINGNWQRSSWFPSKGVTIRGNVLEGVPGDGIVPIGCDSALIEYNVMRDCPRLLPDGESAAGIWPWSCDNTLVQYNEVSDHKAPWDGQGFDADWNCRNTIIQYNYSHNNEGGFLLICNDGSASGRYSIGNTGTIVRYNLSVNDGFRSKGQHAGFSPSIHLAGPTRNAQVYNNVIYISANDPGIDNTVIEISGWNGFADSTLFANNIFYATREVQYKLSKGNATLFENNMYYGRQMNRPPDLQAIIADPRFLLKDSAAGTGLDHVSGFRISASSPAIGKGKMMSAAGLKDFFGNNVPERPAIGLHQAK